MVDFNVVKKLLEKNSVCSAEEITPEKHLVSDLELDSFSLLDTVTDFEEAFHLMIPDRDLRQLGTVQDVMDYLSKKTENSVK